jgi:hypothetical protein
MRTAQHVRVRCPTIVRLPPSDQRDSRRVVKMYMLNCFATCSVKSKMNPELGLRVALNLVGEIPRSHSPKFRRMAKLWQKFACTGSGGFDLISGVTGQL